MLGFFFLVSDFCIQVAAESRNITVRLFLIQVCYVIGHIKAFIPKLLSSQRFHADERR